MARPRIFAPTSMVATSPTGDTTLSFLHRVQNVNTTANIGPQDVMELGRYAPVDRVNMDAPTVPMSVECLLAGTDGTSLNATKMGLTCTSGVGCLSGILNEVATVNEKDVYLLFHEDGSQAAGNSTWDGAIGVGNWRLGSWEMSARVGDTPRESFNGEGSNYVVTATGGMTMPHVDNNGTRSNTEITFGAAPDTTAATTPVLRASDVVVTISNSDDMVPGFDGTTTSNVPVQSVRIALDLGRTPQFGLGQLFRKNSFSNFPIRVTCDIEVNPKDIAGSFDLWDQLSSPTTRTITVIVQNGSAKGVRYDLIGARLDSTNYADAVGNSTSTSTVTWVTSIGEADDSSNNLYIYAVGS